MRQKKIFLVVALVSFVVAMTAHAKQRREDGNLPLPAPQLMDLLEHGEFEILSDEPTGYSTMNSRKLRLKFRNQRQKIKVKQDITVKWKAAPNEDGDGWNNSPRREMAAYAIQQLFLDPEDYVVPPTTTRCIPLIQYHGIEPGAKSNIETFPCVYGALAAWVSHVTSPEQIYDEERFARDKRYAYHMANMNLLTYLINHQDALSCNFLISIDPKNPRIFVVDNGLSLRQDWHNIFTRQWNKIRVPALPRQSIERLRHVTQSDLERLGVLAQMDADAKGILRNVEPRANLKPKVGSRVFPNTIQIGLTAAEINMITTRLQHLLKNIDKGTWDLF